MISAIIKFIRKSAVVLPALLALTAGALTAAGAGELDPTFTSSIYGNLRSGVLAVKPQPDGKTLIVRTKMHRMEFWDLPDSGPAVRYGCWW